MNELRELVITINHHFESSSRKRKIILITGYIACIIMFMVTIMVLVDHNKYMKTQEIVKEESISNMIQIIAEQAYFEGQRDAIENNICITKIDTNWYWTKSPWNSNKQPLYGNFIPTEDTLVVLNINKLY